MFLKKQVDFSYAIRVLKRGGTCVCELPYGRMSEYNNSSLAGVLIDQNCDPISIEEISDGDWYITNIPL